MLQARVSTIENPSPQARIEFHRAVTGMEHFLLAGEGARRPAAVVLEIGPGHRLKQFAGGARKLEGTH